MTAIGSQIASERSAAGSQPFVALAPMDGITDWVYRGLLTDLDAGDSGISLCVSEFVRVTDAAVPHHVLLREVPELNCGGHTRAGVPVAVQLLGSAPDAMAQTAARAVELGAPVIDLNFGCPAKTVNRHDGGASLLREPQRIAGVIGRVVDKVGGRVPVSAKIRLGWATPDEVEPIARAAESGGATWLTVHARTRLQGYAPPVHWDFIARARSAVGIPVVANGDVTTVANAQACAEITGCTALMVGRGAMADPWLFRRLRGASHPLFDRLAIIALLRQYADRLTIAGVSSRGVLGRLKQWLRLAKGHHPWWTRSFDSIKGAQQLDQVWPVLDALRLFDDDVV